MTDKVKQPKKYGIFSSRSSADLDRDLRSDSHVRPGTERWCPNGQADDDDDSDEVDKVQDWLGKTTLEESSDAQPVRKAPELPEEIWRKIFIHASPGRVFDTGLTNNIEEQQGSLCGLGFWRISFSSQWTRYQLCLVCKQFNEIATPLLYRDLRLITERSILAFARTLGLPSLSPSLALSGSFIYRPDLRKYPFRMDVDLSPYLNLKDEEGHAIMELDSEGNEKQTDYSLKEFSDHPIRVLSHLILVLPNLRMFLWDSTENLHTLPPLILTALARAKCVKNLVDLDWFPVSRFNVVAFFELMMAAQNLQHLEIGEMQDDFFVQRHPQISLPHLHTLAISGDGASTCSVFAKADLPALRRLTHWSNSGPVAFATLEMLCAAHGKNLEVLSIWSPAGRRNVEQESYDEVITEVLRSCKVLQILELDLYAPHPLPDSLAPHPTVHTISLGLELHPAKERTPDVPEEAFIDVSPMSDLVLSIRRKAFPKLESVHLLSSEMSAMHSGAKDVWNNLPKWCRSAKKERFVLRDGWGEAFNEEEWWWLDETLSSQVLRSPDRRVTLM